jgi:hypothetical protein
LAAGPAHDHDARCRVDPAGDLGHVCGARGELGAGPQGPNARDAAVGLGRNDVLRQGQVGNASARIGGGNRLMDDGWRLGRRG